MSTTTFARFRDAIASAPDGAFRSDVTLGGALLLARDGRLTVSYAPFEHVVLTARVVIVGITPGASQAAAALAEARRRILAGDDDAAALAAAKVHASFSGVMRDGLVRMLDHVGLHGGLGIPTCARLWDSHAHLAHFTSALRYPVFVDGGNYNGTPSMTRTPLLRGFLADCLGDEAHLLPDAVWVPCGATAAEGLDWVVRQGLLPPDRVCRGLPHPSPANAERVRYFLGEGRDRSALSAKTDPVRIDAARAALTEKVARLGTQRASPASEVPPPPRADVGLPWRAKAPGKLSKPRTTEPRAPSALGLAVQAAVAADPRFVEHQPERLYQCTYRTRRAGTVFAFERVTVAHITLWLPATPAVIEAAAASGAPASNVSRPYRDPDRPDRYGRLSTLASVPELKDAELLSIKISSVGQALAVLGALP